MKKITILLLAIACAFHAESQQNTLQVVGKNLTLTNGQPIILRGVNYGLINQGNISLADAPAYQSYIDEVANTGANAIRIPWYTDGQNWRDIPGPQTGGTPGTVNGYVSNGHLSNIVAYCISKKMIPILSIHDDSYITCKDNWAYFDSTVMNFWTNPDVLALIEANKSHLIINLANEFDYVRWTGSPASELTIFKTNYNAAVTQLRQAGVTVPIMIDAPDCGQSSTELLSIAEEMNQNDSRHNLIFSSHAYWYGYANSLVQVQAKLNEAQNTNVCFILGEVAPNQDGSNPGECGINDLSALYPVILNEACSRNIGWLAWTFSLDCSPARQMSLTASASDLTVFGDNIVNHVDYGLKSTNGCGAQTFDELGMNEHQLQAFRMEPNPASESIFIRSAYSDCGLVLRNSIGNAVWTGRHSMESEIRVDALSSGIYFVELENGQQRSVQKLVVE
ncbi:Mannan endo-1,4-beta-mannosidase precursor [compost metagenome]